MRKISWLSCLSAIFSFLFTSWPAEAAAAPADVATNTATLRVMTINLRHNKDFWEERFSLIADEIVRLQPDLIGIQEVLIDVKQARTLLDLIKQKSGGAQNYEFYGHIKTGGYMLSGEGVGIFSRFPIQAKTFQNLDHGRVAVAVRVEAAPGVKVAFFNTHLHNQGEDSLRLKQAETLTAFADRLSGGAITFLTGDMNAVETGGTIKYYIEHGFIDSYRAVHGDATSPEGNTCPAPVDKSGAPLKPRSRIDFVFLRTPPELADRVRIIDSVVCFKNRTPEGLSPSDHLGVMTTFEIDY